MGQKLSAQGLLFWKGVQDVCSTHLFTLHKNCYTFELNLLSGISWLMRILSSPTAIYHSIPMYLKLSVFFCEWINCSGPLHKTTGHKSPQALHDCSCATAKHIIWMINWYLFPIVFLYCEHTVYVHICTIHICHLHLTFTFSIDCGDVRGTDSRIYQLRHLFLPLGSCSVTPYGEAVLALTLQW